MASLSFSRSSKDWTNRMRKSRFKIIEAPRLAATYSVTKKVKVKTVFAAFKHSSLSINNRQAVINVQFHSKGLAGRILTTSGSNLASESLKSSRFLAMRTSRSLTRAYSLRCICQMKKMKTVFRLYHPPHLVLQMTTKFTTTSCQ